MKKPGILKSIKRIVEQPFVERRVNSDINMIKRARSYDNAPDSANDGEAGMLRSLVMDIKDKYKKPKTY